MTEEQKRIEDKNLFDLKQRILCMISDYNHRSHKLEDARKLDKGRLNMFDEIPKLSLNEQI